MMETFRFGWAIAYGAGFVFFVYSILRFRSRRPTVERRAGPLPAPPAVISWLIPPAILLSAIGQISALWMPVRLIGIALGVYALVVMPWAVRELGHSYAPGPAILAEHALISTGPFGAVRHPIYSAVAALWLGAALGALNWLLLALWPFIVMALTKVARTEEQMLREKFGNTYASYEQATGRLIPRLK